MAPRYPGVLNKLKESDSSGNLLKTFTESLKNQKQRVVLNEELSSWANIETGVLRDSFLCPLLFLANYQITYQQMGNYLQTLPSLFLWFTIIMLLPATWVMVSIKQKNGLFNGKWVLMLALWNKLRKSSLPESFRNYINLHYLVENSLRHSSTREISKQKQFWIIWRLNLTFRSIANLF